jgi:predicted metal-binding membrane protein
MEHGEALIQLALIWGSMMTTMMLPASLPVLWAIRRVSSEWGLLWMFALGLMGIWLGFSIVLAAIQWVGHRWFTEASPAWTTSLWLGLAGGYQFSSWKHACLVGCRSPLGRVLTLWQKGWLGGLRMGFRYGMICVGCCWALMVLMLGVGMMSFYGMFTITALIVLEKLLPFPPRMLSNALGVVLLGAAVLQW